MIVKKKKQEKEKILNIIKNMISLTNSILDTKYKKSHNKVAVIYKNHVVEIKDEPKIIKYCDNELELSNKEHKKLMKLFDSEFLKKYSVNDNFDNLENLIKE